MPRKDYFSVTLSKLIDWQSLSILSSTWHGNLCSRGTCTGRICLRRAGAAIVVIISIASIIVNMELPGVGGWCWLVWSAGG